MMRSFAEHAGLQWPKNVAAVVNGEPVTWAQVHENRRQRQRQILGHRMACTGPVRRAAYVWTFFVPGVIYGGWHLYLCTLKEKWWIRRDDPFELVLMAQFPCGMLPIPENKYRWKQAFAQQYSAPRQRGGEPQGVVFGWASYASANARAHSFELGVSA